MTTLKDKFLKKAIIIHGDKYDYSEVEYKNCKKQVKIICKIHGEFFPTPDNHINAKSGCKKCGFIDTGNKLRKPQEDFIKQASKIHNNFYNYSLVDYTTTHNKVIVICPDHGEFEISPNAHIIKKVGCSKCSGNRRLTLEEFIERSNKIHDNFYDYSESIYVNIDTPVKIKCPEHGEFHQIAEKHLIGHQCVKCSQKGFSKVAIKWLTFVENTKNIVIQHAINGGEFKIGKYKVDGYHKDTNTVFEFYGDLWHGNLNRYDKNYINPVNKKPMEELYNKTIKREQYIKNLGYNLVTIWESDWYELNK